jgi:hypothetical protein
MTDDEDFAVPAEFWKRLTNEQMNDILFVRDGRLNAQEARLLWQIMKRTDDPPEAFQLTTIHPRKH